MLFTDSVFICHPDKTVLPMPIRHYCSSAGASYGIRGGNRLNDFS